MDYLKITFSAIDNDTQEKLIALLEPFDFVGFEQADNELMAFAETDITTDAALQHILSQYDFQKESIPQQNWNKQWEESFEPIVIEDKIAIRADFHQPIRSVEHEIIITPKMSFGTGHHATTQQMLEQMSIMDMLGKSIFDYGTGTGVLAIYASLRGAKKVIANDIDPWSIENTNENIERNRCHHIDVRLGGIEMVPEDDFDIILANINLNVLKADMASLIKKLNRPGQLILSGILEENKDEILALINNFSNDYQVNMKNSWLCITVKV